VGDLAGTLAVYGGNWLLRGKASMACDCAEDCGQDRKALNSPANRIMFPTLQRQIDGNADRARESVTPDTTPLSSLERLMSRFREGVGERIDDLRNISLGDVSKVGTHIAGHKGFESVGSVIGWGASVALGLHGIPQLVCMTIGNFVASLAWHYLVEAYFEERHKLLKAARS
jgi:hypothetical protein